MEDGPQLRADAVRNRARILAAAEEVFAEGGPSASTEEVARRAGVAIGTVFRHFPTKQDLLSSIMKSLLDRLTEQARSLAGDGDPASGLSRFFRQVVEEAAAATGVVTLLGRAGSEVGVAQALGGLAGAVGVLLERGQAAGAVRDDVGVDDVLALLTSTTDAVLAAGWTEARRERVLAVILDGLRPPAAFRE